MNEDKTVNKFLKVIGIAALVAVPVFFLLKKKHQQEKENIQQDDSDIFSEELSR